MSIDDDDKSNRLIIFAALERARPNKIGEFGELRERVRAFLEELEEHDAAVKWLSEKI